MEILKAIKVIRALADGVNPETREPLTADSACRDPQAVMALNRALAAYADSVRWTRATPDDWITTAALSFAGAGIILHTGIGLRWPFTPKTTNDP